jgi:hypothetical protein
MEEATMHEPEDHLLDRIRDLEAANRRWKAIAATLGAALALVLVLGGFSGAVLYVRVSQREAYEHQLRDQLELERQRAMQAAEEARQHAEEARKAAGP